MDSGHGPRCHLGSLRGLDTHLRFVRSYLRLRHEAPAVTRASAAISRTASVRVLAGARRSSAPVQDVEGDRYLIPNLAYAIGYTNSSWTLKVGLLCEHFCRLLDYLDEHHYDICYPQVPDPGMATRPLLDFGAGYVQRSIGALPKQGAKAPWLTSMNYHADVKLLRKSPVIDEYLRFAKVAARQSGTAERDEAVV